ncbi:GTPase, IMAP family member 2, isoform CRA_a [Homo sapiens]|nr:GTPase, IMAP family member 2, isoform CRA_a [Homo sapiens]
MDQNEHSHWGNLEAKPQSCYKRHWLL